MFGFSRNKINASTNSHGLLRLVEIGEPGYAKMAVGQSYEIPAGIPSQRLATAGELTDTTALLWLKFRLLGSYTGPPARPETRGRGVVGAEVCTASRWML